MARTTTYPSNDAAHRAQQLSAQAERLERRGYTHAARNTRRELATVQAEVRTSAWAEQQRERVTQAWQRAEQVARMNGPGKLDWKVYDAYARGLEDQYQRATGGPVPQKKEVPTQEQWADGVRSFQAGVQRLFPGWRPGS